MSKVICITDTHISARNDSQVFLDHFKQFYQEVFFPFIKNGTYQAVIHLGDVFDRRRFINYHSLDQAKGFFFDSLNNLGIPCYMIVGNHDAFFKTTNRVNSPKLLLNNYENFTVIEEPTNVILGGKNVALVPWTPKEEMVNTLNFLSSSDAKYGFGHMQIQSFAMYKGAENEDGMPVDIFNNFKRFFTGHFHHKSDNGKIFYLGAPYEITWSDYDDPKGFHVFDFDADELTFIENPYRMFYKFFYNDLNKEPVIPEDVLKRLGGKYVKVVVQSKNNINHFDNYMSLIDDQGPTDLIVMDEYLSVDNITSDTSIENIEDTLALLRESINKAEASVPVNKEELIRLFTELFAEANALE